MNIDIQKYQGTSLTLTYLSMFIGISMNHIQ